MMNTERINQIVSAINLVMESGELKKQQIIEGLQKLSKKDINDLNFARSLVEFVKTRNKTINFSITDLNTPPDAKFGKKHLHKNWTFRHYTNAKYDTLKSLAILEADGIKASVNTNDKDWEKIGNQGYIFGLIAIDGQIPKRTWLSKFKYYTEYNLHDLSSIWISGDMLEEEGRKLPNYQGSGTTIVAMLSLMLGYVNQDEAMAIDRQFLNKLEAKVPPPALGKPNWIAV